MDILVETVEYKGTLFPVELDVYDADGQQGILVPNSMEYDAVREIAAGMGTSMGEQHQHLDGCRGADCLGRGQGVIQGVSQYVEKKMRAVKITLKAGHPAVAALSRKKMKREKKPTIYSPTNQERT